MNRKEQEEFYFIGQATDEKVRAKASSGGVVRALLFDLLEKEEIDGALLTYLDGLTPAQRIVTTQEEILSSAKSVYEKFDSASAFSLLKETNLKNLAVVGVPCQISAYRRIPEIAEKVKIFLGLYCGSSWNKEAVELLLRKMKVRRKEVLKASFRDGNKYGGFQVTLKNGQTKFASKDACNFLNLTHIHEACRNCQDLFARDADISFGDCWFKEGFSSILVRGRDSEQLITDARNIKLKKVAKDKYFAQHQHVLNLKNNRPDFRKYKRIFAILPFFVLTGLAKFGKLYKRYLK